jgi:ParB-like chromosome segregation protein Spo0J
MLLLTMSAACRPEQDLSRSSGDHQAARQALNAQQQQQEQQEQQQRWLLQSTAVRQALAGQQQQQLDTHGSSSCSSGCSSSAGTCAVAASC